MATQTMKATNAKEKESMEWNVKGVIRAFAAVLYEGFLPLYGSAGVTLFSVDDWEFMKRDIDICEIKESR